MNGKDRSVDKIYLMLGSACNLKCRHCFETDVPQPRLRKQIDRSVLDYLKSMADPSNPLQLIFWGGEPLLYMPLIRDVVETLGDDNFHYWVMSNGVLLTDEITDYLNRHRMFFSVSCDGPLTASVRGINVFDSPDFCRRFRRIERRCIGVTTHAYNINPYELERFVTERVGVTKLHYQYMLKCTFDMPSDLYNYDLQSFQSTIGRCIQDWLNEKSSGCSGSPAVPFLSRGVGGVLHWLDRRRKGLDDEWYPECEAMRRQINLDISGIVHACHNRSAPIGRIEESPAVLRERCEALFKEELKKKPECLTCDIQPLCRRGCPFVKRSPGQDACCEAEKVYWLGALETVRAASECGLLKNE